MKKIRTIAILLILTVPLTGCIKDVSVTEDNTQATETTPAPVEFSNTFEDMFTDRDLDNTYKFKQTEITLNGSTAKSNSESVKIDGSVITITAEGTYVIKGELTDGMIIVDTDENAKPQLVFNGVEITSSASAPLYIKEADKVFITLNKDTQNSLINSGEFKAIDDNNIDGAIFSKQDITFNGEGFLIVTSPWGHGIVCKDDIVFTDGTYEISSANHGITANDSVRVNTAKITIESGKDGIKAENSNNTETGFFYTAKGEFNINSQGDGISAYLYTQIDGGNFTITAGGGYENGTKSSSDNYGDFMGGGHGGPNGYNPPDMPKGGMGKPEIIPTSTSQNTEDDGTSMKGIKTTGNMLISDGTFIINSADDGIHTDTDITINGGIFEISTGDDGIHAEKRLVINNGTINIPESYEGIEGLNIEITDGDITLTASDDGLNAAGGVDSSGVSGGRDGMFPPNKPDAMKQNSDGTIIISGGNVSITASGDGIDSNGSLEITGGYIVTTCPTHGDTATLDYDTSAIISGGTFIGTGATGMAQTFSVCENQGAINLQCNNQSSSTPFTVKTADGKELLAHTPTMDYALIIISTPEIKSGEAYTIEINGQSTEVTAE